MVDGVLVQIISLGCIILLGNFKLLLVILVGLPLRALVSSLLGVGEIGVVVVVELHRMIVLGTLERALGGDGVRTRVGPHRVVNCRAGPKDDVCIIYMDPLNSIDLDPLHAQLVIVTRGRPCRVRPLELTVDLGVIIIYIYGMVVLIIIIALLPQLLHCLSLPTITDCINIGLQLFIVLVGPVWSLLTLVAARHQVVLAGGL